MNEISVKTGHRLPADSGGDTPLSRPVAHAAGHGRRAAVTPLRGNRSPGTPGPRAATNH